MDELRNGAWDAFVACRIEETKAVKENLSGEDVEHLKCYGLYLNPNSSNAGETTLRAKENGSDGYNALRMDNLLALIMSAIQKQLRTKPSNPRTLGAGSHNRVAIVDNIASSLLSIDVVNDILIESA